MNKLFLSLISVFMATGALAADGAFVDISFRTYGAFPKATSLQRVNVEIDKRSTILDVKNKLAEKLGGEASDITIISYAVQEKDETPLLSTVISKNYSWAAVYKANEWFGIPVTH